MKNRLTLFAALVGLGGCAQSYAIPPLAPEHPANASAREAPAPAASMAFEDEPAAPTTKKESGAIEGHGGMHGGH